MKLNPDCIRDILLFVEEKSNGIDSITVSRKEDDRLAQYTRDEIYYHVKQSSEANLLSNAREDMLGNYSVRDLTPAGHEFLANIRKDSLWERTKDTAKAIGASSLKALAQIASGIVSDVIKSYFLSQTNF